MANTDKTVPFKLIEFEISRGLDFQREHPEIKDDYLDGNLTRKQIAEKYGVKNLYPVPRGDGDRAAECIVGFALRGNSCERMGATYPGLIDSTELDRVQGERSGKRVRAALDAMTMEDRRNNGLALLEKVGKIIWTPEESDMLAYMAELPEYRSAAGVKNQTIASELNAMYHGGKAVRNANAVYQRLRQKRLESQARSAERSNLETVAV